MEVIMGRPIGSNNKKYKNNLGGYRVCAETVYFHRMGHGMSQTDFALKTNLSMRTIQRIENEKDFRTTRRTAYKIAQEIINNPPPEDGEVVDLLNKWNGNSGTPIKINGCSVSKLSKITHHLNVTDRVLERLQENGIDTVGELIEKSQKDLLRLKDVGWTKVYRIENELKKLGLELREEHHV
jgi:DNA-directed RNA polymerase alpha subunit